jgi:DNA-binding CsgD family transcriptional regulator
MKTLSIIISSYSAIVSSGIHHVVTGLKIPGCQIIECPPSEIIPIVERTDGPSLIFIDTLSIPTDVISTIKSINPEISAIVIGVYHSAIPLPLRMPFDELISIYAEPESIKSLVKKLVEQMAPAENSTDELTPREKEIVIGVVKGLSNKEIASQLNVSVNTVMTHRRNIASKLQVHSAAGLTIYAIVSKLVSIEDIKAEML